MQIVPTAVISRKTKRFQLFITLLWHYLCDFTYSVLVHFINLVEMTHNPVHTITDSRKARVPEEAERGQPDSSSRIHCETAWSDCVGRQECDTALHCGWLAQTPRGLVRPHVPSLPFTMMVSLCLWPNYWFNSCVYNINGYKHDMRQGYDYDHFFNS